MITSLDVSEISPAPTFWIWRLTLSLPKLTVPLSVAATPLDKVVSPILISLTVCLVDVLED
ncbi:hypothetical protein [Haemophilus haemolyticus]|uniref:hypothetical protein n=1 Tax=Haemophilus haemolyticus TaxID=726 RepID=UPI0013B3A03E|nr:hypothetical protein [Haemophilus haemolyticus]